MVKFFYFHGEFFPEKTQFRTLRNHIIRRQSPIGTFGNWPKVNFRSIEVALNCTKCQCEPRKFHNFLPAIAF